VNRRAFTLLELLLANVVVAILLGGVLLVISSLGREQRNLASLATTDVDDRVIEALRWDLSNADTARPLPRGRGFILIGQGGLDGRNLSPTSRRTRVIYQITRRANQFCLIREQSYLDDQVRPERWEELVASGIDHLSISGGADAKAVEDDMEIDESAAFLPGSSVNLQIGIGERVISRNLVLR